MNRRPKIDAKPFPPPQGQDDENVIEHLGKERWLKCTHCSSEDQSPVPKLEGLILPVTPAPGDPAPVASYDMYTHIQMGHIPYVHS